MGVSSYRCQVRRCDRNSRGLEKAYSRSSDFMTSFGLFVGSSIFRGLTNAEKWMGGLETLLLRVIQGNCAGRSLPSFILTSEGAGLEVGSGAILGLASGIDGVT